MPNYKSFEIEVKNACKKIYNRDIIASLISQDFNPQKMYSFINDNRIGCLLPEPMSTKYKNEFNTYSKNLSMVLHLIEKLAGKHQYVIIKTISSYPHATSDVDVVVKTKKDAVKITKSISLYKLPIPVDINASISWTPSQEISTSFIWNNLQEYSLLGVKLLVPNPNLDTLIRIGHIPFELAEIRLGELLHIYSQKSKIDKSALRKEAMEMGWIHTYDDMILLIDSIHEDLFFAKDKRVLFPYKIPYMTLFKAVIEKKAWHKIWGARYIIKDRLGL